MKILCISACLFWAAYSDYRRRKIKNCNIIILGLCVVIYRLFYGGMAGIIASLTISFLIILGFSPVFKKKWLGAGDIKLLSLCTIAIERSVILDFLFSSFLMALMIYVLIKNDRHDTGEKMGVPMAIPVFLSFILYWGGIIK